MSVVYSDELVLANSSNMLKKTEDLIDISNQLNDKLEMFISDLGNHLSGDIYTAVYSKFSVFLDAIKKQNKIYTNLKSNIIAANNMMLNYMEGYEKIDDTDKEEIYNLTNKIYQGIQYLESGNIDNEQVSKSDLDLLYSNYYEVLAYYKKIEGLEQADNASFSKIMNVGNDIANYVVALNHVQVGFHNSFYNLGHRDVMYYSQTGHYVDGEFVEWESDWSKNISDSGCGPTSYAMVLSTMMHDQSITPETIANLMADKNLLNGSDFISAVSNYYGVTCVQGKYDPDAIETVINCGGGFIGSARRGGHYIAITDVVYKDGVRYFVLCDPYPEFNGGKAEPLLITEEQLREQEITMDFYIAPANVNIETDDYKKITSIHDNNTGQTETL